MARVLHQRRATSGLTAQVHKLFGLEQKMRQYEAGEKFIENVVEIAGFPTFDVVWRDPENLPTLAELDDAHGLDRPGRAQPRRLMSPALMRALASHVERLLAFDAGGGPVLVGCSGGADSLALLALVCAAGHDTCAVYVDHGLRPDAGDAEVVSAAAARFGASFRSVRVDVGRGGNLEARARDARYAALEQERARHRCACCRRRAHHGRPGRDRAAEPPPRERDCGLGRHARAPRPHPPAVARVPTGRDARDLRAARPRTGARRR